MHSDYFICNQCNEYRKATLRKPKFNLCHNCADHIHRKGLCQICRRDHLPLEQHHVAGRKHAPNTIPICLNCHAMLSRRQYNWPELWLKEPCALFLIWGILDCLLLTCDPYQPSKVFSKYCHEAMEELTRKNVIGPFSVIQCILFFIFLLQILKTTSLTNVQL